MRIGWVRIAKTTQSSELYICRHRWRRSHGIWKYFRLWACQFLDLYAVNPLLIKPVEIAWRGTDDIGAQETKTKGQGSSSGLKTLYECSSCHDIDDVWRSPESNCLMAGRPCSMHPPCLSSNRLCTTAITKYWEGRRRHLQSQAPYYSKPLSSHEQRVRTTKHAET